MKCSLNKLYRAAEISKQAVHKYKAEQKRFQEKLSNLFLEAEILRKEHPGCGVEKMYYTLKPDFIGRDNFIEIFMSYGYRVKRQKNYHRTTLPTHYRYPNLIEGSLVQKENQIWQSDITYIKVAEKYCYLTFIVDVYSRRIVGYQVSDNLRAEANLKALKMAIKLRSGVSLEGLIHHSDRGSQYIDNKYTGLLKSKGIKISMGLKAQENAYAERINGVIKNEYLFYKEIDSLAKLRTETRKAVNHYNSKRIHGALSSSPVDFENSRIKKSTKLIIYSDGNYNIKSTFRHLDIMDDNYNFYCPVFFNN